MKPPNDPPETRIALFQRKQVRRTIHNNEWWFVITDVIVALTDSTNPAEYLKKLRKRDPLLGDAFKGGRQIVPPPPLGCPLKGRWNPAPAVLEHRRPLPPHPIHPQPQGRTVQTLAGESPLRAYPGNRKSRACHKTHPRTLQSQRLFRRLDREAHALHRHPR